MNAQAETVARVAAERWQEVVSWLDTGLRRGQMGRLQAEYPISLRPENVEDQFLVSDQGRPLSHAMIHRVDARIGQTTLRLGLIGLVYTEPDARGRGLAGRCVHACVEQLRHEGIDLAVLWSDRHAFYARLGFHPAGRERLIVLDRGVLERARAGPAIDLDVGEPRAGDWAVLERLYAARHFRAERRQGELEQLATGPEVLLRIARREGRAVAYAALGRGDDFAEVIHEWAGEEAGVLACMENLLAGSRAVGLLAGPEDAGFLARLENAGAARHSSMFALVSLLAPRKLWNAMRAGAPALGRVEMTRVDDRVRFSGSAGEILVNDATVLEWLFDGVSDSGLQVLASALTSEERAAFGNCEPLPLYLWGFDSI